LIPSAPWTSISLKKKKGLLHLLCLWLSNGTKNTPRNSQKSEEKSPKVASIFAFIPHYHPTPHATDWEKRGLSTYVF